MAFSSRRRNYMIQKHRKDGLIEIFPQHAEAQLCFIVPELLQYLETLRNACR